MQSANTTHLQLYPSLIDALENPISQTQLKTSDSLDHESISDSSCGTTINLVWVNQQADDLLIACLVDEDDLYNHHLDHRAMVTVIKTKCDTVTAHEKSNPSVKNWHKLDQACFTQELKAHLYPLPVPLPLTTPADIDLLDSHLLSIVITALNTSSPDKVSAFKHKSWWNPAIMLPLRKAAAKARRQARSHPSDKTRATYHSARNTYFQVI